MDDTLRCHNTYRCAGCDETVCPCDTNHRCKKK